MPSSKENQFNICASNHMINLIPPASIIKTKITLTTFDGRNFSAKDPTIPPNKTPEPTVKNGTVCKFPLKQ